MLRLWVYKLLTQAIIWLGVLRSRLYSDRDYELRPDRTFYATNAELWECCDCGMVHAARPLDGDIVRAPAYKAIPVRPRGYAYHVLRVGTSSTEFADETP